MHQSLVLIDEQIMVYIFSIIHHISSNLLFFICVLITLVIHILKIIVKEHQKSSHWQTSKKNSIQVKKTSISTQSTKKQ
jgi:hypothetical protein